MLFSIFKQSLINELNLFSSSTHSLSIIFPFSNEIFILLGNFSYSFIISSLTNKSLNSLSICNKRLSSFSLIAFLILVNTFCIFFLIVLYFQ